MHDGALGEAGLFNLQAIHQHLIHESTDKELKKLIDETKDKVNKLWAGAHLKKFIQWGKDSSGKESNHALNGPALKAVLRHATLLKVTIELMKPIYATLEASKVIKWDANGLPVQPEKPPKKQKGGKKVQNKPPPNQACAGGQLPRRGRLRERRIRRRRFAILAVAAYKGNIGHICRHISTILRHIFRLIRAAMAGQRRPHIRGAHTPELLTYSLSLSPRIRRRATR